MNKNSYVTAALFVVFVLLTVFYVSLGDEDTSAQVGSTTTEAAPQVNLEIKEIDDQTAEELVSNQEGEELDSTVSSIQVQRTEAKKAEDQLVAELTAIIASKDSDAEAKSEAKDNLDKINKDAQHQSMLESMIKTKGYEDVFVRVNEEQVQVNLQLAEDQEQPTIEQINEIIMMAKTEFATDPDVRVNCTPIN